MARARQIVAAKACGFSLIELLVVIGIIAILVLILLPALLAARKQARITETTAELQSISAACEGYKSMFGAYPGPIIERDVAQTDSTSKKFSGTQNMILGLLGGIQVNSSTPITLPASGTIAISQYPSGSYNLYANFQASGVTDLANNSRFVNAFYIPRPSEYRVVPGSTNTNPTLMDHNPDALPILYYRRDVGKTGAAADSQVPVQGLYGGTHGAAFLRGTNVEYTNSTTLKAASGLLCDQSKGTTNSFYNTTVSTNDWATPGSAPSINASWCMVAISWPTPSGWNLPPCPGGFVLCAANPTRLYTYPDSICLFGGE